MNPSAVSWVLTVQQSQSILISAVCARAGLVLPFAPTIRVKRGDDYWIHLTNGLPADLANATQVRHASTVLVA